MVRRSGRANRPRHGDDPARSRKPQSEWEARALELGIAAPTDWLFSKSSKRKRPATSTSGPAPQQTRAVSSSGSGSSGFRWHLIRATLAADSSTLMSWQMDIDETIDAFRRDALDFDCKAMVLSQHKEGGERFEGQGYIRQNPDVPLYSNYM
jgi:hypothetical protein